MIKKTTDQISDRLDELSEKLKIFFNLRIISLQHHDGLYHQHESAMGIHMSPPS